MRQYIYIEFSKKNIILVILSIYDFISYFETVPFKTEKFINL